MTETPRPGDQPLPTPTGGPSMHDLVIADLRPEIDERLITFLRQRKELGLQRYGSALQAHNGRDALRDAVEECADGIVYVRQALTEMPAGTLNGHSLRWAEKNLIGAAVVLLELMAARDDAGVPA